MNNNIVAILVLFVLTIAILAVGKPFIIKSLSKAVVEQMKRDYVPGPYQPGFDPDKIDPKAFQNRPQSQPGSPPPMQVPFVDVAPHDWNQMWESQRF